MRDLPATPSLLTGGASSPPISDEEKVRLLGAQFFALAIETFGEDARECTRLGVATAGHFAGVLFGSLYPTAGLQSAQAKKRVDTDLARHFIKGMAEARHTAAAHPQPDT